MYSRRRNAQFGQLTTKKRVLRELGDELGKLRTSDFSFIPYNMPVYPGALRVADNPDVIAHGYFGTVDGDSGDGILRPASVYSPKKRIVAIASKEMGTHIPFSCPNCIVR
jgi:hypothetical protein